MPSSPRSGAASAASSTAPSPRLPVFSPAWVTVGLLWFIALLNYLDRLMIAAMRDPIKASVTMSDAQFGLLTAVFLWVYGVLSPFGGFLADRFGRSRVIVGSLLTWSAVTWLTGHARTYEEMLVARAFMGISEACYMPAALALVADFHRGATRSLATGIHASGIYTGAALGGVGGYIAEYFGWRAGFTIFGIVGIAYAVLLLFFLRDAPSQEQSGSGDPVVPRLHFGAALWSLMSSSGFWILFIVSALVGMANWCINGWLPTYLREHFQMGLGAAGMSATGYIQVASFAGVLAGGILADRWSRTNPRGRALIPGIGFCLVGPFLFLSASTVWFALAIAGLMVYGLGRGFFDANLMPVLRSVTDERISATGFGILNFIGTVAGGLMIFAGGLLKDANVSLSLIFQASAGCLLLVGILLFFIKPRGLPATPQ